MKKHILLVDDVATNLKCEELILRNQYQVTMVKSGREALECLQTGIPDLVLLDIRMHEMDGYEVLQHMKKDPKTAAVPVMLLTADTEQESEERGIALGAIDFIRKPIEPQLLLERVEAVWKTEE
ncbi:MAG: response regulator [Lachnospiraceae bacterium]|nr:response regulator [Lachnospiraceae bacterium]